MSRKNISSGSSVEELAQYSRAVVDGEWVFVSGTVGSDPSTGKIPEDAGEQASIIFRIIKAALKEADARLSDIVQVRVFLTSRDYLDGVVEVMVDELAGARPTNTTIICQLPLPDAKVEIEVVARRSED